MAVSDDEAIEALANDLFDAIPEWPGHTAARKEGRRTMVYARVGDMIFRGVSMGDATEAVEDLRRRIAIWRATHLPRPAATGRGDATGDTTG